MNIEELKEILDNIMGKDKRVLIEIYDERNNKTYITNIDSALVEHGTVKLRGKLRIGGNKNGRNYGR